MPRGEIEDARRHMAEAEALLRAALEEIEVAPRANKVAMSASLRAALEHVLETRIVLGEIERIDGR